MSDPRNVAHDKKVTQEKKHHGTEVNPDDAHAVQPRKKSRAAKKKSVPAEPPTEPEHAVTTESAAPSGSPTPAPPGALEGSLIVLAQLKEMEFHSRANLQRLAGLMLTVEDELKQKELAGPVGEVYSAQDAFQTKLTTLLQVYKAECDRMQGASA